MELTYEQIYKGRQSWNCDAYYKAPGVIRWVEIKRDAYDHQARAVVHKWNTDRGWVQIVSVPITETPANDISYVHSEDVATPALRATTELLLSITDRILHGTVDSITSV